MYTYNCRSEFCRPEKIGDFHSTVWALRFLHSWPNGAKIHVTKRTCLRELPVETTCTGTHGIIITHYYYSPWYTYPKKNGSASKMGPNMTHSTDFRAKKTCRMMSHFCKISVAIRRHHYLLFKLIDFQRNRNSFLSIFSTCTSIHIFPHG